jgi:protein-S-isoprenylcysteine O-methyltransferase Ste14
MSFWFVVSVVGIITVVPIHFLSVEHLKLEKKFGPEKGKRIGSILGMVSGWGIFLFMIGLWISPQPQFFLPIFVEIAFIVNLTRDLSIWIPYVQFIIAIVFIIPGAWLGIKGVTELGLKESETHHPEKVITTGLYSRMRHPQYTGAILSHIGISYLFAAYYSILMTPLVILVNYILCWKEEKELVREFGEDYENYQKSVPMFIPKG